MSTRQDNSSLDYRTPVLRIENVVGTMYIKTKKSLQLKAIASKCSNSEYNPKRFNALIWRSKKPKATFLIFSNGKCIVVGCKS